MFHFQSPAQPRRCDMLVEPASVTNLADVLAETCTASEFRVHAALLSLDGTGNRSGISLRAAGTVAFGATGLTVAGATGSSVTTERTGLGKTEAAGSITTETAGLVATGATGGVTAEGTCVSATNATRLRETARLVRLANRLVRDATR